LACEYFDRMEYLGASSAEYTILANQWMKNIVVEQFHVPENKIKVFQYGFDTEAFLGRLGQNPEIRRPEGKTLIIFAGRLVEIKGVHHLLQALAPLKEHHADWVCWILGDGDMQAELQLQSHLLGLSEKVVFWGRRDDVPAMLRESDIFVLPSLIENQPLSVIEAQLAGKAIIVSNAGGLPEMIQHGVTGLVSPAGDAYQLYGHLKELLENESYRKKLGDQARIWGTSYWSMDHMVDRMVGVYKEAIAKRHRTTEKLS